jgi:hypothetical protein
VTPLPHDSVDVVHPDRPGLTYGDALFSVTALAHPLCSR